MIEEKNNELPREIIEKGYSLVELGINECAWRKDEVEKIIFFLKQNAIPILGGDVYEIKESKIVQTYDSWYVDNDGSEDFVEKSLEVALAYINNYENCNGNSFIYVLVY